MYRPDFGHDYPFLGGVKCDRRLLRSAESARASKLNSISEYVYQSIMTEDSAPELSALFGAVAMDEMRHYRGLSRLIYCLGGNPCARITVCTSRLSGGCECEGFGKLLASDIADEKHSEKEYLRLAASTGDPVAANFFTNLADDEANHVKLLCEARDRLTSRTK